MQILTLLIWLLYLNFIQTSKVKQIHGVAFNFTENLRRYSSTFIQLDNRTKDVISLCPSNRCFHGSWDFNGLYHFRRSLELCIQKKSLVVAVMGTSVSCGAGSNIGGFVSGLKFFLEDILKPLNVTFNVRNIAVGGQGPKFSFLCNELEGDEDLIVWETIHTVQNEYTEAFLRGIIDVNRSPAPVVIVMFWQPPMQNFNWWGSEEGYHELIKITRRYSIPFLDTRKAMTGPNATCLPDGDKYVYRDIIHPNENGHLLITCLLSSLFERVLHKIHMRDRNLKFQKGEVETVDSRRNISKEIVPIYESLRQFTNPICYSMLKASAYRLLVTDVRGFKVVARPQAGSDSKNKRCWQGNAAGDYIEFKVDVSTSILLVYYQEKSDAMGKISVTIDGHYIRDVDGWYEGVPYSNGESQIEVIATGLPLAAHLVRFEILKEKTRTEGDDRMFQVIAVAVSTGHHFQLSEGIVQQ